MKKIYRFDEEDLRQIIMKKYNATSDQVLSVHTEEVVGYGQGEHIEPVFYIEVTINENKGE